MAIKKITPSPADEPEEQRSNQLPLLREYHTEHPECVGVPFPIETARLSRSKEWLMIDTDQFRVMYHSKSAEFKTLMGLLPKLNGVSALQLVVIPEKGKKGIDAYVASNDEVEMAYFYSSEEGLQVCSLEAVEGKKRMGGLTPERLKVKSLGGQLPS
jgi:hypothetical protein